MPIDKLRLFPTTTVDDNDSYTASVGNVAAPPLTTLTTTMTTTLTTTLTTLLQSAVSIMQPLVQSPTTATSFPSPTLMLPQWLRSSLVAHPPSPTTLRESVGAIPAGTPDVSDDSDNTTLISSDVAPAAASITAGTPDVSDDSDNTASVGSDVAPAAASIFAGTSTVSDDFGWNLQKKMFVN